ncbi:hypothetical protein IQ235_09405 [Oscillatoriales cyanobacterium LEGE 11467]|uniref:Uncharacterized protein n=1 Tax=Zarconia navalis LEGE 11467 TaxID=1828826 RepID=A0A928W0E4_9CYAN|nr:hypothetical protein [Zarconia navalis]MBE9040995.1 hypothetical protein [Zarconia navalis LEGE 11467]
MTTLRHTDIATAISALDIAIGICKDYPSSSVIDARIARYSRLRDLLKGAQQGRKRRLSEAEKYRQI